jgi:uncharacterized protein YecE (DUF72 family)
VSIRIGTAGWSVPAAHRAAFPEAGSLLERYAARFDAVEINSSFYRPHRPSTYARWAASVPDTFRFAAKLPREVTHARRLVDVAEPLDRFLGEVAALGHRLGPILVQLPPSLAFEEGVAEAFLSTLRDRIEGAIVCEPRHAGWFTQEAGDLLAAHRVARVAADPARVPEAAEPGGWSGLAYYRLHGSPRMYYSGYEPAFIDGMAGRLDAHAKAGVPTWVMYDNTASGHATGDALATRASVKADS